MKFNEMLIGKKVVNKKGEEGEIVAVEGENIRIQHGNQNKWYSAQSAFIKTGYWKFKDPDLQAKVDATIEKEKKKKAEEELRKKQEDIKAAEKRAVELEISKRRAEVRASEENNKKNEKREIPNNNIVEIEGVIHSLSRSNESDRSEH